MLVTINTDASFHPDYKVGAYAYWIVCNQGRIIKSGPLRKVHNSTEAETQCIANALHDLLISDFTGVSRIIINTDSMNSIRKVKKKSIANSPERICYNILKQIREKYRVYGRQIHKFKHVKAHSGTHTKRQYVNDWCDKTAKKEMRKLINVK